MIWAVTWAVMGALSLGSPSWAQQKAAPAPVPAPALSQPQQPAIPAQAPPALQAPAPSAIAPSAAPPDASASSSDSRLLKSTAVALRELSPWSMFLSADVLVKAVMIGLAFASLLTWTIFIAKI
ncbi:MAG TPA: tonB-system energizer ExbB, partial [Pseudolabrys sp.]|nr:tonB-system energizer ExbB [Pseudolabrys sp.]